VDLREYFELGLTVEAFESVLSEEQMKLHALHERRAEIADEAVEAVRSAMIDHVLAITEPWCGDSLAIFPVVSALFRRAGSEVHVILRDEHTDLIDQFLTRGGRAIPIVLALDEGYQMRFRWGPRPAPAQQMLEEHRESVEAGRVKKAEVHKRIRSFYGRDRGRTIVAEILAELRV